LNLLVFNCGSSSIIFKIFSGTSPDDVKEVYFGKASRVGVKGAMPSSIETRFGPDTQKQNVSMKNHRDAAELALQAVSRTGVHIDSVGHRFVHGGGYFHKSVLLDAEVMRNLELCRPLAPIHNPNSVSVIGECKKALPNVPEFVAFDSAFHHSLPPQAYTYALPRRIVQRYGFRKYGFHGLSYQYVTQKISSYLGAPVEDLKIVACHLGTGGSSVAAIAGGRSLDTSMGYSPLPGLLMSTRCGDIDPMLAIYLMTTYGYRSDDVMDLFNKRSGLLGVSGFSSDIRDIILRSAENEEKSALALTMYIQRVKKYIGSFVILLGGMDVLAFTDDIGLHNPAVREKVCKEMGWCGLALDLSANNKATGDSVSMLSAESSRVRILAVPTDEELIICLEGLNLLGAKNGAIA
jgi:acetate kinase